MAHNELRLKRSSFNCFALIITLLSLKVESKTLTRRETIKIPVQPHLAAYPSPDDDGTYYIVNLSDPPHGSLQRIHNSEDSVQFFLHTKKNDSERVHKIRIGENNPAWLQDFDPNTPLKILCHGYKSSPDKPFPSELKTFLLYGNSVNVNVIVAAWDQFTDTDMYKDAINNMNYVAEKTTDLLTYMYRDSNAYFKKVHFIGHNLGAHIGGITGQLVQTRSGKKLGRITGLDPGGVEVCDPKNVLDPSDAEFVEAIHTDDGNHCGNSWLNISNGDSFFRNWGFGNNVGHVDFYPLEENLYWKSTQQRPYFCAHCRSYKVLSNLISKLVDDTPICDCKSSEPLEQSQCICGSA